MKKYTMFGLLYFSQGTVLSYFTALNGIYFLDNGLTMSDVGIFATIALIPFIIKIFLGMLSDKVNLLGFGHRKPYIILGLIVQAGCLLICPFINLKTAYWGFVALAFALQMAMALYDTCTDGLALDTIPEEEEATIQSFMVGGRALGVVITALLLGYMAEWSWVAVFWMMAGFTLLPLPLVLGIKEAPRTVERSFDWGAFSAFRRGDVLALAGLGFVFFFIIAGINQMVNPFLETTFDVRLRTLGFVTAVFGTGAVLGGVVGGRLINHWGKRRSINVALAISLAAGLALAITPNPLLAWPIVLLFGLSYGTYQTLYYALAMQCTDTRIAASMFSIMMAATNIAQGAGMAVSGILTDKVGDLLNPTAGFRITFAIIALLNLLALPLRKPALSNPNAEECAL